VTAGYALGDIVAALAADRGNELGARLIGDAALRISRVGPLDTADPATLSFLANPRYRSRLEHTAAGGVIVQHELAEEAARGRSVISCDDPYRCFARLTQWWARQTRPAPPGGIHPSAVVDPLADVDATASIGPLAVVEAGARIGAGCVIGPHCCIGRDASIGEDSRLAAHVVVGSDCHIGARALLHSGVVIGADGFGFAPAAGAWEKIEQLGAVRIGDDVEIGANACVDRGALDDTVIEDGVKLDNLVQIAHNVRIGAHTAMAGSSGVAGSSVIGSHCMIGGAAVILGHLQIADGTTISAASVVMRSIRQPGTYSGIFPIDDNAAWEKNAATLRQLHSLRDRLRALERWQVGLLEKNTP
jgi:UDP-3-O-[3-hydroxymyristoyl] glucosamine N-acyltransferase